MDNEKKLRESPTVNNALKEAAPDLLKALWSVLGWAGDCIPDSVEREALDAVAKATGNTHELHMPEGNNLYDLSQQLLMTCWDALAFIERHKSALIGNECTSEEYEAIVKPIVTAIAVGEEVIDAAKGCS